MDLNLFLSIAGLAVGFAGVAIAIYQSRKIKHVNRVINNWGKDLLLGLDSTQNSLLQLLDDIKKYDVIQWPHSQNHIRQAVQDLFQRITHLSINIKNFLSNVLEEK